MWLQLAKIWSTLVCREVFTPVDVLFNVMCKTAAISVRKYRYFSIAVLSSYFFS